ncbi:hypothetical protein DPEC_G00350940 [Dallia pectoralis]|uniref:Uncharacterized protein n=1 Tax=Dallia pectoralis TaxID=75939 RepID=A0ACC2F1Y2_DALPE|nr:hypothetical protein DPEC_G00350940 [Dallia pectoralis]
MLFDRSCPGVSVIYGSTALDKESNMAGSIARNPNDWFPRKLSRVGLGVDPERTASECRLADRDRCGQSVGRCLLRSFPFPPVSSLPRHSPPFKRVRRSSATRSSSP